MDSQFINEVLELVNEERSERGLNSLELDDTLVDIAEDHSQSMANNDFFGHKDPTDGSSPLDRIDEGGYEWSRWGENVAAGLCDSRRCHGRMDEESRSSQQYSQP